MKTLRLIIVVFCCTSLSFSQSRTERKRIKQDKLEASYNKTKALIESGKFNFEALWATPLDNDAVRVGMSLPGGAQVFQGGRVNLTGNSNYVRIDGDNAKLFLPYFGRVLFPRGYMGSTDNGIEFDGKIEDVKIEYNEKKKRIEYKFKAKKENDELDFHFSINADGATRLNLNSTNRQIINYDGKITAIQEDN